MTRVKVSQKFQIAVPAAVRRKLGIKAGDTLIVDARDDHMVIMREPEQWERKLWGFHAEVWEGVDAVDYVRRERGACEED